jgi:hypothetical protein
VRSLSRLPDAIRGRIGPAPSGIGLLVFSADAAESAAGAEGWFDCPVIVEALGDDGDLEGAARRLFGALRALDAAPVEVLLAEPCPSERGLGHAITDRLRRASTR